MIRDTIEKVPVLKPVLEFLSTGPGLVGFIYGVLSFKPDDDIFKASVQSMLLSLLYMGLLAFNHSIAFLDLFGYQEFPFYADSVFAIIYLVAGTMNYLKFHGGKIKLHRYSTKIVDMVS